MGEVRYVNWEALRILREVRRRRQAGERLKRKRPIEVKKDTENQPPKPGRD